MKTQKPIRTNLIYKLLLVIPAISLTGLAACSNVAGTADEHAMTPHRVATYMVQSNEQADSTEPADDGSGYEWFY
jgi:hypothetical protein